MLSPKEIVTNHCADVPAALIDMHFARMPDAYFERFAAADTARHVRLLNKLEASTLVAVDIRPLGSSLYEVSIAGVDLTGVLACITSAVAADGFSVQDVQLFSWMAPDEGSVDPTYFVDVLRVGGSLRGRSAHDMAQAIQSRLQRSFEWLSQGRFAEAQAAACDAKAPANTQTGRHTPGPNAGLTMRLTAPENQVFGGDFRVTRKLASGGMGEVYLAQQLSLERTVVVKIVYGEEHERTELQGRMAREAGVLAKCNCPYIVQVFASGVTSGPGGRDLRWLAMEYLPGGDLAEWATRRGPVPVDLGLRWLRQSLEAIGYAHKSGILHRDIKPHNLLLTQDGNVKVADFGLVKQIREAENVLTSPGAVMGTPVYMSPEQALGEPLDERSDLYSLGMTFFHLFSGKLPFEKSNYTGILVEISQRKVAPLLSDGLPGTPRGLQTILSRLLAPHPEERYQNAKVALEDLASYEQRGLLHIANSGDTAVTRSAPEAQTIRLPSRK